MADFNLAALKTQLEGLGLDVTVTTATFMLGADSFSALRVDRNGVAAVEENRVWFYNNHIGPMFFTARVKRGDVGFSWTVPGWQMANGVFVDEATPAALVDMLFR